MALVERSRPQIRSIPPNIDIMLVESRMKQGANAVEQLARLLVRMNNQ